MNFVAWCYVFFLGSVGSPLQETAVVCPEILFKHADCAFVSFERTEACIIVGLVVLISLAILVAG